MHLEDFPAVLHGAPGLSGGNFRRKEDQDMTSHESNRELVLGFHRELDRCPDSGIQRLLERYYSEDHRFYGVYPWDELQGPRAITAHLWEPLRRSWKFLRRKDEILFAGTSEVDGTDWAVRMGYLHGLLDADWLGIPATGKLTYLRYAEFNCIENGRISRSAFFCDILAVMQQAEVFPLPWQAGAAILTPGPRTGDGLLSGAAKPSEAAATLELMGRMVNDLDELNRTGNDRCPPEVLRRTWREDMMWHGPAGIGSICSIERYQQQHQHPFREGLADKVFNGHVARFAEGSYGGFFGWPNLTHSPRGGYLGLPPCDRRIDMRVVDIYRRAGDKLAENWVLIDLPHWLRQQGIEVLAPQAGPARSG